MSSTFPRLAASPLDTVASQIHVLRVGPWQANEFGITLREVTAAQSWQSAQDISEARATLSESVTPPELLVLAQPLPGHYRQIDIDRLQSLAPLARIVVVAGTWCEGEMRTGKPLSGVLRLYWYEFAPWWEAARLKLAEGKCPPWSMPLDSPNAGRFQVEPTESRAAAPASIAISTTNPFVYDAFAAALPDYGMATTWVRDCFDQESSRKYDGGIWDGSQLSPQELLELDLFCRKVGKSDGPVFALLDFPRAEHAKQVTRAGAKGLFAKPYVTREIAEALR